MAPWFRERVVATDHNEVVRFQPGVRAQAVPCGPRHADLEARVIATP
jgi:hypothetical protein